MKKLLLLFLFALNLTTLNAQWIESNNGIPDFDATWCFITDGNNTYTGITGGVFMTTNNGVNWIAKNNGLISVLEDEKIILSLAIDGNNIFAGTMIDGIFLSTDKGENWERKSNGLPTPVDGDTVYSTIIYDLKIIGNNIYAGTNIGVYLSTDNGDNWTAKNNGLTHIDSFNIVLSITNIGDNIFAGTKHSVYMTTNKGDNWLQKNKGIEIFGVSSLITKGDYIYAGGGPPWSLILSTDNGDNWKIIKDSSAVDGIAIIGNNIFIGGYGVEISTDNGKNWTVKNSGLPYLAVDPLIINGEYIFAGVDNYGIFRAKLSDLGITDVKEQDQTNEIKIEPNPASDKIKIKLKDEITNSIELHIFNSFGQEIIKSNQSTSDFRLTTNDFRLLELDVSTLSNGVYFAVLELNGKHYSKPFVVLR